MSDYKSIPKLNMGDVDNNCQFPIRKYNCVRCTAYHDEDPRDCDQFACNCNMHNGKTVMMKEKDKHNITTKEGV